MRRWAIVVASLTLFVLLGNTLLAAEPEFENLEDFNNVEFFELVNDGRLVLYFTTNENDVFDGYNSSPVSNIKISLNYLYNGVMTDVRGLEDFKNTNLSLVSDNDGRILLENIPYGLYQYSVVEVPMGYKLDQEVHEVEITLMDVRVTNFILIENETVLNTSTYEPVIEEIDNEEKVEYIEVEIPTEEVMVEKNEPSVLEIPEVKENASVIPVEEISVQKVNLNNLAEDIVEEESGEETVKNIIDITKELARRRKVDMYAESRSYQTRDTLRLAITTVDNSVLKIADLAKKPTLDKNKKDKLRNNNSNWKILEEKEDNKFLVAKIKVHRRAV